MNKIIDKYCQKWTYSFSLFTSISWKTSEALQPRRTVVLECLPKEIFYQTLTLGPCGPRRPGRPGPPLAP